MPQRFLRPGITNSDKWNAVSFGAQSMYIRILTLVDDYGRYDGRLPILHAHCFALRNDVTPQDSAGFFRELQDAGLLFVYTVDNRPYLQFNAWQERVRGASKFPEPPNEKSSIPQDSAADRSGNPQNPASLAIVPSHSHSHSHTSSEKPASPSPKGEVVFLLEQMPPRLRTKEFHAQFEKWIKIRMAGKKVKDWQSLFSEQLAWMEKNQYDEATAMEILSASIRGGWAGLFEPKPKPAKSAYQPTCIQSGPMPRYMGGNH